MKRTRQFYVPDTTHWNWRLVSPVFVKLQLTRAQDSYVETDKALASIEAEVREIRKRVWEEWETASATRMRQFERQIKDMSPEVKRIHYVRKLLRDRIDEMHEFLNAAKVK